MIKVISNNQLISERDIYNKVNSVEEVVSLTKVKYVYFCAFGTDELQVGNDLEEIGTPTWRVEDYCDENGITYDSLETIDRDTEKVTQWFLSCEKNGFTPFWFVGISYKDGYKFSEEKRTNLKSDLYVGQKVWFAHGVDIREGEIIQVCLRSEMKSNRYSFPYMLQYAFLATGVSMNSMTSHYSEYLDSLSKGYVIVKSNGLHKSDFNLNKYMGLEAFQLADRDFAILPLDKVFTKSPF